jgi:dCMP deaminase
MSRWDSKWIGLAQHYASWSKDSTQVGCVVVSWQTQAQLSQGYNGPPRGVDDDVPERRERPAKYLYAAHAEENAIAHAAKTGTSLAGATIYVTFCPCAACARMIIQAGICEVVMLPANEDVTERWADSFAAARDMFYESGVTVRTIQDDHEL